MATTPEGAVKKQVTAILKTFLPHIWWQMPVPGGYGKACLDYHGTILGMSFAIETKAPGKKPTARQNLTIRELRKAGDKVFIIDGKPEQYADLMAWLEEVMETRAYVAACTD